ncbi:preprotein translocase, SecE subunit [Bacteriovorax sp. BSW11_IV]|uniref:preprotein translocase subunit SecE n=1 Tax=Bacteriovorax sp. BSW11_IV TaxID=1353529 RepID=UPI00038A24D8|nr:preprotein translocase subunit SecE [Bacteriovorax sp. BSW11_IV]EQC46504.1 preprotein translocase, SecE subunit [Bacteriovorax sp. BSW11_IV]
MSLVRAEDKKKWINAFVAIMSILCGYTMIRFVAKLGEWFDLEAKIGNFLAFNQGVGILVGLMVFVLVIKNRKATEHMDEVYEELVKVSWANKDAVLKITVGLVIGLSIVSGIFVLIDLAFREILNLIF